MQQSEAIKLVREMIKHHFQEAGKGVHIRFVKKKDFYMAVNWNILGYRLFIDKAALNFTEPAFKGCLAHELSYHESKG